MKRENIVQFSAKLKQFSFVTEICLEYDIILLVDCTVSISSNPLHFSLLFKAVLRMRLRIQYTLDGQQLVEQTEVSGFPDQQPTNE